MPKSPYAPCIPTRGTKVPSHPDWIHEVKQDGYRLIVSHDGDRVRLFTRNGYDLTSRYALKVLGRKVPWQKGGASNQSDTLESVLPQRHNDCVRKPNCSHPVFCEISVT